MDHALTRAQVVDLLRYRQQRSEPAEPSQPRLAIITPFRPLTPRQIEHRARMLKHLGEADQVKGQRSKVKGEALTGVLPLFSLLSS